MQNIAVQAPSAQFLARPGLPASNSWCLACKTCPSTICSVSRSPRDVGNPLREEGCRRCDGHRQVELITLLVDHGAGCSISALPTARAGSRSRVGRLSSHHVLFHGSVYHGALSLGCIRRSTRLIVMIQVAGCSRQGLRSRLGAASSLHGW